jgi:putative protease
MWKMPPIPELISPAGNLEKLRFALHYGADAVYLGWKEFSLREGAGNLSLDGLAEAVKIAHSAGKKIFLAVNIYFHNRHIEPFKTFIREIESIPVDAFILSDLGAIAWMRENYPAREIHVSTQANTTNIETARFYERLGIGRAILARELTLDEIAEIAQNTSLQIETFVHGAMCIAYSGRCLLSNYFTSRSTYRHGEKPGGMRRDKIRSANLGDCAQPCRWNYVLMEPTREHHYLPIEENEHGSTILSSRDLNLSGHIPDLLRAGISGFKIEGRMKSIYYVANTARVYRHTLDCAQSGTPPDPAILAELDTVSHRPYTTGFYFMENEYRRDEFRTGESVSATDTSDYTRHYKFVGTVLENLGGGRALVRAQNQIRSGEVLDAISPRFPHAEIRGFGMLVKGTKVDIVQPNTEFTLECGVELEGMDLLRRSLRDG